MKLPLSNHCSLCELPIHCNDRLIFIVEIEPKDGKPTVAALDTFHLDCWQRHGIEP